MKKEAVSVAWEWIKKQWKALLGLFVGVMSVMLIMNRKGKMRGVLEEKQGSQKKIEEAEKIAKKKSEESIQKNLDIFLEKNKQIDDQLKSRLLEIEESKEKEVESILKSDSPNEVIAERLRKILED